MQRALLWTQLREASISSYMTWFFCEQIKFNIHYRLTLVHAIIVLEINEQKRVTNQIPYIWYWTLSNIHFHTFKSQFNKVILSQTSHDGSYYKDMNYIQEQNEPLQVSTTN
jgi:hypothetical protein